MRIQQVSQPRLLEHVERDYRLRQVPTRDPNIIASLVPREPSPLDHLPRRLLSALSFGHGHTWATPLPAHRHGLRRAPSAAVPAPQPSCAPYVSSWIVPTSPLTPPAPEVLHRAALAIGLRAIDSSSESTWRASSGTRGTLGTRKMAPAYCCSSWQRARAAGKRHGPAVEPLRRAQPHAAAAEICLLTRPCPCHGYFRGRGS